jgi:lambda family phage tail tape measure protein
MAMLARLGVVLGLDSAEFQKGLAGTKRELEAFGKQAATVATAAAGAFAAMTMKVLDYADAISDTAKANDVAVRSILALGEGLRQNGGEAENAEKMLSSFASKVDSAAQGGKEAQQSFQRLGISLNDLSKLSMEDLFTKTATALSKQGDSISRNALAMDMFGKAAKGVDFKGLIDTVSQTKDGFAEYEQTIERAAAMHDELQRRTNLMTLDFTKLVIPTVMKLADSFDNASNSYKNFLAIIDIGSKVIASVIKGLAETFNVIVESLKFISKAMIDLSSGNFSQIGKDYLDYVEQIEKSIKSTKDFIYDLYHPETAQSATTGKPTGSVGRQVTPAKDAQAEALRKALEQAKLLSYEYERQSQFDLQQLKIRGQIAMLTDKERQIEEAVLSVREKNSKQLQDIEDKITDALIKREPALADELRRQKAIVEDRSKYFEEETRREIEAQQKSQNSFEYGWNRAFRQYREDSENYARLGQQAFESVTGAMTSAIDKFVSTGKFSFSEFASSIIKDLLRIEMQMQAMELFRAGKGFFSQLIGSFFGGGGGGGPEVTNYVGGTTTFFGPPRATGGYMDRPSIVGENGPELFIPSRAGTVIPNGQLSGMMGNQPQVVYNGPYIANMSAIDTQSAAQFLAKNKMSVWAANQSANRSIPVSR